MNDSRCMHGSMYNATESKLVKLQRVKITSDGRIIIGKMIEDVYYKILKINNPLFLNLEGVDSKSPPLVGESVRLDYYKDDSSYYGLERLSLFIFRNNGPNYVRRFDLPEVLEQIINGIELEPDKDFANKRINTLLAEIQQYRQDYLIEANK
jgi:hypothetical protein